MQTWTLIYGGLTVAAGIFSLFAPKPRSHVLLAAGLLATSWVISAAFMRQSLVVWIGIDAVTLTIISTLYNLRNERWKLFMLLAILLQCVFHASYWFSEYLVGPLSPDRVWQYKAAVNVLFVGQLVSVGGPGALNVASRFSFRSRDLRPVRDHAHTRSQR